MAIGNVWSAESTDGPAIEEVVVTASRIERPDFSYSNPVLSVDSATIRASGEKNITDLLKQIPALSNSWSQELLTGQNGFDGANGLTALDLRGLGPFRTLVLVNGRRSVGSPFPGGSVVDVDSVPMHLIERVEVMTGGASALYGADGVSGVVNFVMKDRYEGFEVFAQTGASSKHDAQSTSTNVTYGTAVAEGRGHLSLALGYSEDNRISPRRRGFSSGTDYAVFVDNLNNPNNDPNLPSELPLGDIRYYDYSTAGAVDINLDAEPEFDGDGTPWDAGQVPFVGPFYSQGGDGQPLVDLINDLLPDEERYSFNAMFDFEVSESMTFFSELSYMRADSYSVGGPSFDYALVFLPGSAYVPANVAAAAVDSPAVLVNRDNFDFGKRSNETERETLRTVVGFEGAFTPNLEFEVSYTYGETDVESRALNNRYNDRFAAALDAVVDPASGDVVCASELDPSAEPFNLAFQEWNDYDPQAGSWAGSFTPGAGDCVPINIFGDGSPSREAVAWIHTDSLARANMKQQVAQAYLRGNSANWLELPAGPVGFVLGTEWRKETISADPADEDRLGYTFGNKYDGERGNQSVRELFAEIDVPLLAQRRFAENLAVDAAIRYSDYSTIGETTTWKVGLVWQPWESLTLRSTLAEATRAPSIGELFTPLGQTFEFISDPCDVNNLQNGTAFRTANCAEVLTAFGVDPTTFTDPYGSSTPGLIGGNRNLTEETADTITFGVIFTPTFIESLTVSIDWYDIELVDAIEYSSPQDAADLCVDSASINNKFCDSLTRDPVTGGVAEFIQGPNNVASLDTRGVDFTVSYFVDPSRWGGSENWGTVALTLNGNKLQELEKVNLPGAASISEAGQVFRPEWQANFDAQWQGAKTSLTWRVHYFDETERYSKTITDNNPNITSSKYLQYDRKLTQDLYGSYQFNEQLNVFAGVNNLTDEKPDIGEVFYPVSPLGRYLYAGLNFKL